VGFPEDKSQIILAATFFEDKEKRLHEPRIPHPSQAIVLSQIPQVGKLAESRAKAGLAKSL